MLNAFQDRSRVIPYPALDQHGIVGDRRTAALVASDGTLDWLCLPDFDGDIVFGVLLDYFKGGYWRIGPARMASGQQDYWRDGMVLETRWDLPEGALVLHDAMLWPENRRPSGRDDARVFVRRLRCSHGVARCEFDLRPGFNFREGPAQVIVDGSHATLKAAGVVLRLWTQRPLDRGPGRLHGVFELHEGEEFCAALTTGTSAGDWSPQSIGKALDAVSQYWNDWQGRLRPTAKDDVGILRAATAVHLLTYAPEGAVVAAPTTSVPERIGGSWNADYRLCWVRDASLAVSMLAWFGNLQETEQYLRWLGHRRSLFGQPLQVLYGIRGEKRQAPVQLPRPAGYRDSPPVRVGNHAYKQHQLGSYGYLADCAWIYLCEGGRWRDEYGKLIRRVADYTAKHWQEKENGIWELSVRQHYLNSKVMSWVTLDRAVKIAQQTSPSFNTARWKAARDEIFAEVMAKGWSERMGAFRQHYGGDSLDSAALLIPVMGFLPADHPRVVATMERIAEYLSIDDFVFRFDPPHTKGIGQGPLGQMEGAFFPSTFWLVTAYAKAGRLERAEAILRKAEQLAGPLRLYSEAADPRDGGLLGNTPLLFSCVEYVRAKLEIARARGR